MHGEDLTLARLLSATVVDASRLALIALVGCAQPPPAAKPEAKAAGRIGVHGMVALGRTVHYFEHIPMFRMPHDEQLVLRVDLRDAHGAPIDTDLGSATFTFEPAQPSSLDDLNHAGATLTGAIHRGSFERGGEVAIAGVTATVTAVVLARSLPGSADHAAYVFGPADDAYVTVAIGPDRPFQQILHAKAAAAVDAARRLAVGDGRLAANAALDDTTATGVELVRRRSRVL